jgi:hypothetical protein
MVCTRLLTCLCYPLGDKARVVCMCFAGHDNPGNLTVLGGAELDKTANCHAQRKTLIKSK